MANNNKQSETPDDIKKMMDEFGKSKNFQLLERFSTYCLQHPEERFWQALRNWSGQFRVFAEDGKGTFTDTFNWEGKDK